MRIHLHPVRLLAALSLALSAPAFAGTTLNIHAQLKQPKSATCAFFRFGGYLALSGDDAVVGEPYLQHAHATAKGAGCTAIFAADGADGWTLKQLIDTSGPMAVSGDRMLVKLFTYRRDSGGAWQTGPMLALPGFADAMDAQNAARSVTLDGSTAVVGVPAATVNGQAAAGALYIYGLDASGTPSSRTTVTASDPALSAQLGWEVSLFGDTLAARTDVSSQNNPTSLYIFEKAAGHWTQSAKFTDCLGPIDVLNDDTIAYVTTSHRTQLLQRTSPGQWLKVLRLTPPHGINFFLASDHMGRLAVGSSNDAQLNPIGGLGGVDTYEVMHQVAVEGSIDNDNPALSFGGPLAVDPSRLLVTESTCDANLGCNSTTVDVVEADNGTSHVTNSSSGGSGGLGLLGLMMLATAGLLRRRH
ncbi:MAG TPA: hypothetical protein VGM16_03040 [Gammaproteobacteria bacterium]|jgi:MYXO-CTERM domain-containing protein